MKGDQVDTIDAVLREHELSVDPFDLHNEGGSFGDMWLTGDAMRWIPGPAHIEWSPPGPRAHPAAWLFGGFRRMPVEINVEGGPTHAERVAWSDHQVGCEECQTNLGVTPRENVPGLGGTFHARAVRVGWERERIVAPLPPWQSELFYGAEYTSGETRRMAAACEEEESRGRSWTAPLQLGEPTVGPPTNMAVGDVWSNGATSYVAVPRGTGVDVEWAAFTDVIEDRTCREFMSGSALVFRQAAEDCRFEFPQIMGVLQDAADTLQPYGINGGATLPGDVRVVQVDPHMLNVMQVMRRDGRWVEFDTARVMDDDGVSYTHRAGNGLVMSITGTERRRIPDLVPRLATLLGEAQAQPAEHAMWAVASTVNVARIAEIVDRIRAGEETIDQALTRMIGAQDPTVNLERILGEAPAFQFRDEAALLETGDRQLQRIIREAAALVLLQPPESVVRITGP